MAREPVSMDELIEHTAWVRRLARSLVADEATADDIVQQTWVAALEHPPRVRDATRPWLQAVVRNFARLKHREESRRRRREERGARSEPIPSEVEMVERVEIQRAVVDAVLDLDEPYRHTILLRFFHDLGPLAIARELDVPESTVKTRLQRGLARLRETLSRRFPGEQWLAALLPLARLTVPAEPSSLLSGSSSVSATPWVLAGGVLMSSKKVMVVVALILAVSLGGIGVKSLMTVDEPGADSTGTDVPVAQNDPEASGAELAGNEPDPQPSDVGVQATPSVAAGGERKEVDATPRAKRIRLVGQVVNTQREPIAGARITVYLDGEDWSADGESDESGRFEFPEVPEGWLNVRAEADGYESQEMLWLAMRNAPFPLTLRLFLPRDGVYSGRVVDEAGKPIAGAKVWVMPEGTSGFSDEDAMVTEADGFFSTNEAPSREGAVLFVMHDDYKSFRRDVATIEGLPETIELDAAAALELSLIGRSFPERVLVELNRVAGNGLGTRTLPVRLNHGVGRLSGLDVGRFDLRVLSFATRELLGEAVAVELRGGELTEVRVPLLPPGAETVTVVHVVDTEGAAVAGAGIRLYEIRGIRSSPYGKGGTTDAEGVFLCREPMEENTAVTARKEGYAPAVLTSAASAITDGELTVQLVREAVLEVIVRDDEGALLDEVTVNVAPEIHTQETFLAGMSLKKYIVTREGRAAFGQIAENRYRVAFQRGGERFGEIFATLSAGETTTVEFQLPPRIEVAGVILENGAPVKGGSVRFKGIETSTWAPCDERGGFAAALRAKGQYRLSYARQAGAKVRNTFVLTTLIVTEPRFVELSFKTADLEVVVLGIDGEPQPKISGRLRGPVSRSFQTDSRGRARVSEIAEGEYSIEVVKPPPACFAPRRIIEVRGETRIEYRLLPAIEIAIAIRPEEAIRDKRVTCYFVDENGNRSRLPGDPLTGRYRWPAKPGKGVVSVRDYPDQVFTVQDLEETKTVEVFVRRGGILRVHIESVDGFVLTDHPFVVDGIDEPLDDAMRASRSWFRGRTLHLLPGRYRVSTTLPSGQPVTRVATVVLGETSEIVLP